MIKYREILRLSACGLSQNSIARSVGCAQSTVSATLKAASEHGVIWPLPDEMDDRAIYAAIHPKEDRADANKAVIDHEKIESELKKKSVTLSLLWSEYCQQALAQDKEPYMYSAFCSHHRAWQDTHPELAMHIVHKPGEVLQVDWVGDTMAAADPDTGALNKVYVFAACLPFSAYFYLEGFYRMDEQAWINAHIHAFQFFEGTPLIVEPDNLKTGVIKHTLDELVINEQYRRMCEYYNIAVIPTRIRKPKDKASVEMSVGVAERSAIAALRNCNFIGIEELNRALIEQVRQINARPFQKRQGSRQSIFLGQEKICLQALPPCPYQMVTRKHATVQFNYHVVFEGIYYSVPFSYVRREVELVASSATVAIICDGQRIAQHMRSYAPKGTYITNPDHMPQAHRDYAQWNGDRFRRWAASIGPCTQEVIEAILTSRDYEQQSYRSCMGVLSMARKHGEATLEKLCAQALQISKHPSYKTIKTLAASIGASDGQVNEHAYLRGDDFYRNL